jgi:hypothetical protein
MKKFATVLLSICLILSMCVASFAAVPDLTFTSSTTASIREVVKDLGANPSDTARETVAKEIISILEENGADTTDDLRSSAKILRTNGIIDDDLYNTMISIIDKKESEKQDETQEILDQMKSIIEDSSLSTTEKAQKIYALIKDLPAEEAQKILDAAKDAGIIDEETYNKISDLFNGNGDITLPDIDNAGSGIKDLVSKILDKIGIGGGDSDDSGNSNSGSSSGSSSSSSNKTDFEGATAKTGDYAVASVAGVAAVAGAVLVLTRKKNEDK